MTLAQQDSIPVNSSLQSKRDPSGYVSSDGCTRPLKSS
jgi:hypothetical protein